MAGEAAVADARIDRCRRPEPVCPKRLVEGDGIGQVDPGRAAPACYAPQVVGVGVVIIIRGIGDDAHGDELSGQRESHPFGGSTACWYGLLVVGEGGVDLRPVGLHGQGAVAVGVVVEACHLPVDRHARQPVLDIEGLGISDAIDGSRGHVAVAGVGRDHVADTRHGAGMADCKHYLISY